MNKLIVNTDGGSRGNPGPAAIGVVFSDLDGKIVYSYNECIGKGTNNEAEYTAIIRALEILSKSQWMKENNSDASQVLCKLDSQLVVEQLNGRYKIKQDHLRELVDKVKNIILDFKCGIVFSHIPREENKLADKLVNEALDKEKTLNS